MKRTYWIEKDDTGERLFCYKIRRHGRYVVSKFSLAEIQQILEPEGDMEERCDVYSHPFTFTAGSIQ